MSESGKIPFFSVIIPAHNSAAYIRKLLDSIAYQSFTDYELIVVCDACTDNTHSIAEEYTDKVFDIDCGRDGLARNCGLDHAEGEWVLFADDDDWFLHEFVFEQIAGVAGKNNEDVLAFSFIWKGVGYSRNTPEHMWIAVWNKCWRRSSIADTRFSDAWSVSDKDFNSAMMSKNLTVATWDMPMYYYNFMRKNSITYNDLSQKGEQHETL